MKTLPINLNVEGRICLLVGGGTVALQKAEVLTAAGMGVRVVAPWVMKKIEALPGVTVIRREFRPEDLDGVTIAIAATDNPDLNHRMYALAGERGIPANCVDDPAYCDFIFPSILRRGELAVSVSTGGGSPALARLLREWLESKFDGGYGEALQLVAEMRALARKKIACPGARRAANECVARMALRAAETGARGDQRRRMEGVIESVADPSRPRIGDDSHGPGRITLVGAGPGDPDLITVAGARALAEADLVVYDRLVNPELLRHASHAHLVYAGKQPGEPHEASQGRINQLLVEQACAGRNVVRLKGGDPFVFGRGGEEVLAARAAGIEVRVIPGITAALGAAAATLLPLTHRKISHSVAFVTGCPAADEPAPHVDWQSMGRAVDTIVLYMSVRHLAEIAGELMAAGRAGDEPVVAIANATTPEQTIRHFTLAELRAGGAEGKIAAPAIVVIGQVVRLQHELDALVEQTLARA